MSKHLFSDKHWILPSIIGVLLLLNLGVWLFQAPSSTTPALPAPQISNRIADWEGHAISLSPEEYAILKPAKIISRVYYSKRSGASEAVMRSQPIWLHLIYSAQAGTLHNFYDSLIASGAAPILGTQVVHTRKGLFRTSLIHYRDAKGQQYLLLLWYQWQGGNAENRWQWYWHVLQRKIQRKSTMWELVEVATPIESTSISEENSIRELTLGISRLKQFAAAFYESSL